MLFCYNVDESGGNLTLVSMVKLVLLFCYVSFGLKSQNLSRTLSEELLNKDYKIGF